MTVGMINFKPELVRLLSTIDAELVESYPDDWTKMPTIVYEEEANKPDITTTAGESSTYLRYRIEIYSNKSTSELKISINNIMTSRGFTRASSVDINESTNKRHTIMRFEGSYEHGTGRMLRANNL